MSIGNNGDRSDGNRGHSAPVPAPGLPGLSLPGLPPPDPCPPGVADPFAAGLTSDVGAAPGGGAGSDPAAAGDAARGRAVDRGPVDLGAAGLGAADIGALGLGALDLGALDDPGAVGLGAVDRGATPGPRAAAAEPAGWFGKIPAVGDFVGRRLPEAFRGPWDRWLQDAMALGDQRLGSSWTELYMTFPIWRFLVPRGVLGPQGWTGILLPSVDRVGRRFPLTIAESATRVTARGGLEAVERRLSGFAAIADQVLDGLGIEPLEAMLQAAADRDARERPIGAAEPPFAALTDQLVDAGLGRRVLWWLAPDPATAVVVRPLPLEPETFVGLVADP
jgi:type VI secretion system ImpM family protein